MRAGSRSRGILALVALALTALPGCATMRCKVADPLLRPCSESFAYTKDGWRLGMRCIRPARPDPAKLPVVLCHGLGLNATFWTIYDNHHLAEQLASRGYIVYLPDMRGSGASQRLGPVGKINSVLRQTPLLEIGEGRWNVDDQIKYDVPAILDYVKNDCGYERVNWVGHSLGGMLMFAFLETDPHPERVANFVAMGAAVTLANAPESSMLLANRALRVMLRVVSTGRIARPMRRGRPPGLEIIDGFYYTAGNVDRQTIDRFYGYTLENPGRGALAQLDPYLEKGRFVSADRRTDYVALLPRVTTPVLFVAGEHDVMSSVESTLMTYDAISSRDKELLRFGRREGHVDDYGHCDLVWSKYAPVELFPPVIDWLDRRQPAQTSVWPVPQIQRPSEQRVDAELRPRLETRTLPRQVSQGNESRVRQARLPGP
jgi:lysosomal acid lipase/cholesteryl ester hydrolase